MTPFSFADFEVEAQRLVAEARAKAQAILAQAMAESNNLREQAREEGLKAAARETANAVAQTAAVLNEVAYQANARRETLKLEAERDCVRLALAIAGCVVKGEITLGRPVVERNAKRAIELLMQPKDAVIRVNPAEATRIAALAELAADVRIQPDPAIEPGGVIVDSPRGGVDLDIKTQLERIERELLS
jgi:flagellar assembly protein FliH